ncbi:hypothetical protein L484_009088 [Morus notabilis]|uniref:Rapid alkalinization factor n=1 Tax=Morus notabilis TaxID=981085 RepID=W9R8C1_9ROSA|nr:rapid alkalinization factor [Morus notabilis]EXB40843.1 hypothetical protein L484_009088 [Morus notabilis]
MANFSSTLLAMLLYTTALTVAFSAVEGSVDHRLSWLRTMSSGGGCRGSIAECMAQNDFDMELESKRRILATSQYISYGSLQRNTVPCSRRGASYYNCKQGAEANPYNRECSSITRCRS